MGLELQDEAFGFGDFFNEPEGFFPPPKPPTFSEHRMLSGDTLSIRLVGSHPLYGYLLWNAARTISDFLEENASEWVEGKDVLELGAGAGLPSIICAIMGAKTVVVTDYPDHDLIDNMRINASVCEKFIKKQPSPLYVDGYKWGDPTGCICRYLESPSGGFDVLILADVIYNHPQHHSLIDSVKMTLKRSKTSVAFVVFTPYQPWLLEKITAFFPKAEQSGFTVKKIFQKVMDKLLFENDPGDEQLRRTVFGYELRWKEEELDSEIPG
ncbi:nicotinamide N-methyltransferase [Trichophyton rubrum]|uniref:Protein N-terminal and lysine N-methyltransferase EFM7 n=1 Tax=Trichophyton rubrum TaxID=5551 RepID=A0A178ETG9_TRIRU|nr:putative nicotinamide N-methyltransferase [Trichophyton rubrum]OAL63361.1 nicotinamide N-methyltransferase [Trichophyton rubrum]